MRAHDSSGRNVHVKTVLYNGLQETNFVLVTNRALYLWLMSPVENNSQRSTAVCVCVFSPYDSIEKSQLKREKRLGLFVQRTNVFCVKFPHNRMRNESITATTCEGGEETLYNYVLPNSVVWSP